MSVVPSRGPSAVPYWKLKQLSRALSDAGDTSDRAMLVHRLYTQRARQRQHVADEHDAMLRAASLYAERGETRSAYQACRFALAAADSRHARQLHVRLRRTLAGLDDLNAASLSLAGCDPTTAVFIRVHKRLENLALQAQDGELAFEARKRVAMAHEKQCATIAARDAWRSAADIAPTGSLKQFATAEARRVVLEDSSFVECQRESDTIATACLSNEAAIAAHSRLYESACSLDHAQAAALAADRLSATHTIRGEFSEGARWATEATSHDSSAVRRARLARARADLVLFEDLLPELRELNDLSAYVRVGKDRKKADPESARVIYLAGRAAFPDAPELLNALAGVLRHIGHHDLAWAQTSESLALVPSIVRNRAAHTVRGFLLCDKGRASEALACGLAVAAAHPSDGLAHRLCAWAYVLQGDAEPAIEHASVAARFAKEGTDVIVWLCGLRTSENEAGATFSRLRTIDRVIDHLRTLRGEAIWEGSLAGAPAAS